jgi:hypothetical protein
MESLGIYIRQRPCTAAAIAFGSATAAVAHFAWFPDVNMGGAAPVLTVATGVAHALAATITGPRLMDRTRTQTSLQACLIGAGTSLLALVPLAPLFVLWVSAMHARPEGAFSYILLMHLIGLLSFLAAGWALPLVSVCIGWGLYQIADRRAAA